MARTNFVDTIQQVVLDAAGRKLASPLDNVQVTVWRLSFDGTRDASPATIYTSSTGSTPHQNPFITVDGIIDFWANDGQYELDVTDLDQNPRIADDTIGFAAVSGFGGDRPGSMKIWPHGTIPDGWLLCNGQTVLKSQYPALYAELQDSYNTGGETSAQFRLPDLRGRQIVGAGTHADVNAVGKTESPAVAGAENRTPKHNHADGTLAVDAHQHAAGAMVADPHVHSDGSLAAAGHAHKFIHAGMKAGDGGSGFITAIIDPDSGLLDLNAGGSDFGHVDYNGNTMATVGSVGALEGSSRPVGYFIHYTSTDPADVTGSTGSSPATISGNTGAATAGVSGNTSDGSAPFMALNVIIKA